MFSHGCSKVYSKSDLKANSTRMAVSTLKQVACSTNVNADVTAWEWRVLGHLLE